MRLSPAPAFPALVFRKSSYSSVQNCLEFADLPGGAAIRDSKHPEHRPLAVPNVEWAGFVGAVKQGRL
ncbi:DUF397 domain-containing protein [Marinitenerispora sediminis]|uniref:DUF397 domain-containing protein n=1 Tax=Marinitenerispora sediminis TaxID=1931232 RepID=UPI001F269642|nr:DUF397 domain-containing protein [Marinitenerispora sediminis]